MIVACAVAVAAFMVMRPDLPPRTDIGSVERALATGQVGRVDLVGDTLTVRYRDGGQYRVEPVEIGSARFKAWEVAYPDVSFTATNATRVDLLVEALVPALLPPILLATVVVWAIRRSRRATPSGNK